MPVRAVLALVLGLSLLTASGCAGTGSGSGSGGGQAPITRDDIVELSSRNAYEVVQRLRPAWFRPRGRVSLQSSTAQNPTVYVDGIRYGDIQSLRQLHVDSVETISYLGSADATTRFGTGHVGGAILVLTRR